jgi:hypothetical protein
LQWKESIIVAIHKKGDRTDSNNYRGISLLSTIYKILSTILLARLTPHVNELLGIIYVGSVVIDLITVRLYTIARYWRKNGSAMEQCIGYL